MTPGPPETERRSGPSGAEQAWSADGYARNARFVSDLGTPVLEWLAPMPGERILDLGCGDGALTAAIAETGAEVLAVDSSPEMLSGAKARGLAVRRMDGAALSFAGEFDAVFSNAALHWMPDAAAVVGGVKRALKPGGRFVAEFGGHGNVAAIRTAMGAVARSRKVDAALAGPWYFPTAKAYADLLNGAGFVVRRIELIPRPTPLPTGLRAWLETFAKAFIADFEPSEREAALDEIEALLAPSLRDEEGQWTADYVRLRVDADRV